MTLVPSLPLLNGLPAPFRSVQTQSLDWSAPFIDLVSRFADEPGAIALLSGGNHDAARFHLLGLRPWLTLSEQDGLVTVSAPRVLNTVAMDPFDALQAITAHYALTPGEPIASLRSGLLGYLAYDLNDVLETLPRNSRDDLHLPRMWMTAPSILVVHDRQDASTSLHAPVFQDSDTARRTLDQFQQELSNPPPSRDTRSHAGKLVSGLSRDAYLRAVESIRDYIARGHVYQVNMSQRFETSFEGDAFSLFRTLYEANPAPFFAYLHAGNHRVLSTSPERFIELRGRKVETRPIKGTRPRGRTPQDDQALRRDLECSTKDDSELSMVVDLLRNDIGKVCVAGSVRVLDHKRIETYENVMHLVSLVQGELDEGQTAVDLIRATFPGGSITGCPKIRAMEVIDELEPVRRHLYTGSIGYLDFEGNMDLSIAIRTATITDGRLVYSVGGGIVHDSLPADEFEETLHKGRTIAEALEQIGDGTRTVPNTRTG